MLSATLFALFLLSSFSSSLPSATANYVFDTDGVAVRNGGAYYMLPAKTGSGGGGVEGAATGKESCALTVVQSLNEDSKGLPIKISNEFITFSHISEFLGVSIEFPSVPACASTPSEWTVVEGLPEGRAVKLTGYRNAVEGRFAIDSVERSFNLRKNVYKLMFCPDVTVKCEDLGVFVDDDGNRRLVVTDKNPFLFKLQKAASSSSA